MKFYEKIKAIIIFSILSIWICSLFYHVVDERALASQGFSNIKEISYVDSSCPKNYPYQKSFIAIKDGQYVDGSVCFAGIFKKDDIVLNSSYFENNQASN